MKKRIFLIGLILSLFSSTLFVKAKDEKEGYIYSYWGDPIPSALGLTHVQTYDKYDLNVDLIQPEDIFSFNGKLYIVDSKANSLIVLDNNYQKIAEVKKFFEVDSPLEDCVLPKDATDDTPEEQICQPGNLLNEPKGIAVTNEAIYIADFSNNRILKLNHEYKILEEFGTPDDKTFEKLPYKPQKVAVDKTGRIYVIALDVYEGIIELNIDGSFNRFTGVNPVTVNFFEAIRRRFASEKQLSQMSLFLPTSFTNMVIDKQGFIYATAKPSDGGDNNSMIKMINPKGLDVLKRNGYSVPKGDLVYAPVAGKVEIGPSTLVDIALNDYGTYTVLDQKRGRLFTYDNEGRLLYISAEKGLQEGKLSTPVSLTYFGEQIIVLDQKNQSLEVYGPTQFGELVNKAVEYHSYGEFDLASKTWAEVAKLNTNYEIAYIGIGKSLLGQQKYKEAMANFKRGNDKDYYGKAFEGYRKQIVEDNFTLIMTGVIVVVVFFMRKPIYELFKGEKEDRV